MEVIYHSRWHKCHCEYREVVCSRAGRFANIIRLSRRRLREQCGQYVGSALKSQLATFTWCTRSSRPGSIRKKHPIHWVIGSLHSVLSVNNLCLSLQSNRHGLGGCEISHCRSSTSSDRCFAVVHIVHFDQWFLTLQNKHTKRINWCAVRIWAQPFLRQLTEWVATASYGRCLHELNFAFDRHQRSSRWINGISKWRSRRVKPKVTDWCGMCLFSHRASTQQLKENSCLFTHQQEWKLQLVWKRRRDNFSCLSKSQRKIWSTGQREDLHFTELSSLDGSNTSTNQRWKQFGVQKSLSVVNCFAAGREAQPQIARSQPQKHPNVGAVSSIKTEPDFWTLVSRTYLRPVPAFIASLLNAVFAKEKSSAFPQRSLGNTACFSNLKARQVSVLCAKSLQKQRYRKDQWMFLGFCEEVTWGRHDLCGLAISRSFLTRVRQEMFVVLAGNSGFIGIAHVFQCASPNTQSIRSSKADYRAMSS